MQFCDNTMDNILVVPLRFIGDTILTVPLITNLKKAYPNAAIDLLASKIAGDLLAPCPDVNDVITEPKSKLALLKLLKAKQYNTVFILRKSVTFAALCKLAGIPLIVGYDKQRFFEPIGYKRWGLFLDKSARYPSLKTDQHQANHHLGLLKTIGINTSSAELQLWSTEEDNAAVNDLLQTDSIDSAEKLAVIHAASASHGKMIKIGKYIDAVQKLNQQGYTIIATGVQHDSALYEELAVRSGVKIYNWAGQTTLRQTVALYQKIQLILTVDSSPLHMAAAVGVPNIIGVFGPTNHQQWGVLNTSLNFKPVFKDLPCRPCYAKVCEHNQCKTTITAQDIATAIEV